MPVMYAELQRLARRFMRSEAAGHSLQPTALVHEAYLRLMSVSRAACDNRTQFVALAASLMRHVLVDHARSKQRVKRGGQISIVALTDQTPAAPGPGWEVIALMTRSAGWPTSVPSTPASSSCVTSPDSRSRKPLTRCRFRPLRSSGTDGARLALQADEYAGDARFGRRRFVSRFVRERRFLR